MKAKDLRSFTKEELIAVIVKLSEKMDRMELETAELGKENRELRERLNLDSRNSSKPPSQDVFWKKPSSGNNKKRKKKKGSGRPGASRGLLPPDRIDSVVPCPPSEKCSRGGTIESDPSASIQLQQFELPPVRPLATEYRLIAGHCSGCGTKSRGALPPGVPAGMLGPGLKAWLSPLSGKYRPSKREIQSFCEEMRNLKLSLGSISNNERSVSAALESTVREARAYVRKQPAVGCDETSHRTKGAPHWMRAATTPFIDVFLIRSSRSAAVAKEILGENPPGIVGSDRYSGYSWIDVSRRQVCRAHLIRDFRRFFERPESLKLGVDLSKYTRKIFLFYGQVRDGTIKFPEFRDKLRGLRSQVENLLEKGRWNPHPKTAATCFRVLQLKPALWTFSEIKGVEPTNNASERALRHFVIWRKKSFGSQSERGNRFIETLCTVPASCKKQGRAALDFIADAIRAHSANQASPSLIPSIA